MPGLKGKRILLTGATGGLGMAIAHRYASAGAHLILLGRSLAALERLDDSLARYGVERTLISLDLRHFDQIHAMGAQLFNRFGFLDGVVGNAALLGTLGPIHHLKADVWHDVMAVNVSANWHLIQSLDPLLRHAPSGRAIFVTSNVTERIFPYWSAYSVSKKALENLVLLYAEENRETRLKINLIDPGAIRTPMRAAVMPGENPETVPKPEEITDAFVYLAEDRCHMTGQIVKARFFTTPDSGLSL
jgi:NAD(P)-dependent dehydrogenase (short-subunit alcohol dehydrogenase family)